MNPYTCGVTCLVGVKPKKFTNIFKFVAYVKKDWRFIILFYTAYHTKKSVYLMQIFNLYKFAKII